MNDDRLHEPDEERRWLPREGLVSLLDIVGGGNMTCDECGRWQGFSAIGREDAREQLAAKGWTFPLGRDLCPKCSLVVPPSRSSPQEE
jgi:hypothetical protein